MKISETKSFSLFEILVAALLTIIITIVFFNAFVASYNYMKRIMELRTATLALQEEVSLVRELKFSDIKSLGTTFSSGIMSSLKDAAGTIEKSLYDGNDDIVKITFGLDWTSFDNKSAHKSIATLMTNRGINKK